MVTSDMGLVAALSLHHISPTSVSVEAGRRTWTFEDSTQARSLREAYFANSLNGPLSEFNLRLRQLAVQLKEVR
jgi:hypothetical protein